MNTPPSQESIDVIETRKDRLNLRPALAFVEQHLAFYDAAYARLMALPVSDFGQAWVSRLDFSGVPEDQTGLQITPDHVRAVFARFPEFLLRASSLLRVNYQWHHLVPVPNFQDDGRWDGRSVDFLTVPDLQVSDRHQQRMLIGLTSFVPDTNPQRTMIIPTSIPPAVSANPAAIFYYQLHVMLHEFFHTIEMVRRDPASAAGLPLGVWRSFEDWRRDFLESLRTERGFTSDYAGIYKDDLYTTEGILKEGVTPFDSAVCEQMGEAFVGFVLDVISNLEGYTSFRIQSFGNSAPQAEVAKHGGASRRYGLMKELWEAHI